MYCQELVLPNSERPLSRGRIRRTMPLAGFTARAAGGRIVAGLREKTGNVSAVERFHKRTAERYTELLGHSKGVLMKAGQLFSMVDTSWVGNGEISPYQAALTGLQADAPPMDPTLAKEILQTELGRPVGELFAEFTDEPMAAASIGQVHRAVLPDGRQVAVKIQYPGVAEAIGSDLTNTELLTTIFRFASSASGTTMPDLRQATQEISARISEELDYRHEAANITAFSELYRGHPFIRVPEVVAEASADRVLTMTYLDGLNWTAAQRAGQELKNTWAEVILRFVAGSYRHANVFNADPHPGNYRFGTDGTVGFVDFGCVKALPERHRYNSLAMFRAALEERKDDMHHLMTELGYFAGGSTLSVEEAYEWVAQMNFELLAPQPVTYTPEASKRAVHALIDIRSAEHPVRRISIPEELFFLSRITLGINAICAALQATIYARAMADDMDGVAEPVTELGKQHVAWVRQRGLPFGMDHHDQP
jgi:predicted unusual protein kinase regulating ubiquinone biosynthesis (AarF/ABC1/UbiB family)